MPYFRAHLKVGKPEYTWATLVDLTQTLRLMLPWYEVSTFMQNNTDPSSCFSQQLDPKQ